MFFKKQHKRRKIGEPSARQQAFAFFREGERPAQVCKNVHISFRTTCRYYEDFKKLHNRVPYSAIRKWTRENPEFSDKVISLLATGLGMPVEEVKLRCLKPWGLLQAMKGEWPNPALRKQQTLIERRLEAALEIVHFAETFGRRDPQAVREEIKQLVLKKQAGEQVAKKLEQG